MWLCTQHGFFSIVQKSPDEYHLRARVRQDLVNLKELIERGGHAALPDLQEWPSADYRWRIIVTARAVQWILARMVDALDYDNFKGRILSMPGQRDKAGDYSRLWHAGVCWQHEDATVRAARDAVAQRRGPQEEVIHLTSDLDRLTRTSVDDLRSTLPHQGDAGLLRAALRICEDEGMKTKAALLARRIKQLT
jgi:hypothetical protein